MTIKCHLVSSIGTGGKETVAVEKLMNMSRICSLVNNIHQRASQW